MTKGKRLAAAFVSTVIAAAIWLPAVHLFFRSAPEECLSQSGLVPKAQPLAQRHLHLWEDAALRQRQISKMRASNAEWDFMGRSFLAWSMAEIALREPARKAQALAVIDRILDETLRLESQRGMYFFLMPYANNKPFVVRPEGSQFIDGEIALMLAMRRLVEEKAEYRALLAERVKRMVGRMEQSPVLSAESYPDECWTFCNSVALAAIRLHDHLDGTDHSALIRRWIETAKARLIDPATGLLVSAYRISGETIYGPEGSSIWMVSHCLRLVDEEFARDQYVRARRELGRTALGFGYAREWPIAGEGHMDVDSGTVIPGLNLSVGSSGMALIAAGSFKDADYFTSLCTTLDFAAFPTKKDGEVTYAAANQVGEAALLYAMTLGPAWEKARKEKSRD